MFLLGAAGQSWVRGMPWPRHTGDLERSPSVSEMRCSGPEDGGNKVSWGPQGLSGLEGGKQTLGTCETIFQGDLE